MNIHLKSETKEAIKAFSISGIIIVLFYLIISNFLSFTVRHNETISFSA